AMTVRPTEHNNMCKTKMFERILYSLAVNLKFKKARAKRFYYKATMLKEISVHPPEHRILALIDFLKNKYGTEELLQVELTRQQIADLTGQRVETVIRAIKQLEQDGELKLIKQKVFR